ncbi:hypothetical protein LOK49_LG06G00180 [Camellia lanceoleosa]|uniref:Uncharacterized protein n=1 Tax=Camellia lanceoleosa TaxID=1840588 RepID=A0ACC0HGG3_9ERIC|nr:hypothetical protein LOK49_LG06G00180 [Camellia lanceoleosa]
MMAFNTNYKDTGLFGVYAIAKLKSSLLLHIDGTCPVAEDIGRQDVAIAAMGPIQGLPYYNWFRRRTYWLRY